MSQWRGAMAYGYGNEMEEGRVDGEWKRGAAAAGALELIAVEARYWDETVCMSCLLVLHTVYEQRALACLHRLHY